MKTYTLSDNISARIMQLLSENSHISQQYRIVLWSHLSTNNMNITNTPPNIIRATVHYTINSTTNDITMESVTSTVYQTPIIHIPPNQVLTLSFDYVTPLEVSTQSEKKYTYVSSSYPTIIIDTLDGSIDSNIPTLCQSCLSVCHSSDGKYPNIFKECLNTCCPNEKYETFHNFASIIGLQSLSNTIPSTTNRIATTFEASNDIMAPTMGIFIPPSIVESTVPSSSPIPIMGAAPLLQPPQPIMGTVSSQPPQLSTVETTIPPVPIMDIITPPQQLQQPQQPEQPQQPQSEQPLAPRKECMDIMCHIQCMSAFDIVSKVAYLSTFLTPKNIEANDTNIVTSVEIQTLYNLARKGGDSDEYMPPNISTNIDIQSIPVPLSPPLRDNTTITEDNIPFPDYVLNTSAQHALQGEPEDHILYNTLIEVDPTGYIWEQASTVLNTTTSNPAGTPSMMLNYFTPDIVSDICGNSCSISCS